jgi:hypothetical protein
MYSSSYLCNENHNFKTVKYMRVPNHTFKNFQQDLFSFMKFSPNTSAMAKFFFCEKDYFSGWFP